jgi:hypothetical protein
MLCLAAAAMAAADGPDPLKIKPNQTMAGGDSHVHAPLVRLIPDQAKWTELWNIHKGAHAVVNDKGEITYPDAPKTPEVDFTKNQVIVVFGGKLPNVLAYEYAKTYARDDTAVVQLTQKFAPPTADEATYYPFILLVVPKEPVKIEIQLDSIAKDGTHFWMKLASYPAPKADK